MRPFARAPGAALAAVLLLAALAPPHPAAAQSKPETRGAPAAGPSRAVTGNVPNPVQGFSQNRNQPIHIEANSLEVHDKDKVATFRGKVHVIQGDTHLRCNVLVVYYEPQTETSGGAGSPPGQGQRIRRLVAKGNVVVTQRDQTATGETGEFDMRKNVVTLRGNVVVSQGPNVLRGDRLIVDMTTGVSHMESDKGRVQGLFQPSRKEEPAVMPRLR